DGGSDAFGGSRPPAEAKPSPQVFDGGVHIVIGDAMAETCAALLRSEGCTVITIDGEAARSPGLSGLLRTYAGRGGGVSSVLDVCRPTAGTDVRSLLRTQFAVAQAAGGLLCPQGKGAF